MKYKVAFLLDKKNIWFEKYLKNYNFKLDNKYFFKISKNPHKITKQDLVFPLSYTKILSEEFIKKNGLILIVHASKLPKDKGFAPVQNQILKNKNKIYISLIKADKKVDCGPIYLTDFFTLADTDLSEEIRFKQGKAVLKIIKKFLVKYPKVKCVDQKGRGNFNKRRKSADSELNINKSIKSQFNLLRVCDNEQYPSFFKYKKHKYIIKIYKEN